VTFPLLWAARQLCAPMSYLRIRHGDGLFASKRFYDFVLPTGLAALTCAVFYCLEIPLSIFSHEELVKRITDILVLMIVFYMAALAAVATFERKGIDERLKDEDALLWVRHHDGGEWVERTLSYRQFISYLFGYLSFLSLCLYMFITVFALIWPQLEVHFVSCRLAIDVITNWLAPIIFFLVFASIWQLTVTSLLGIYFLTERIQSLNEPEN